MGFRVQGSGFRVQGPGSRVQDVPPPIGRPAAFGGKGILEGGEVEPHILSDTDARRFLVHNSGQECGNSGLGLVRAFSSGLGSGSDRETLSD